MAATIYAAPEEIKEPKFSFDDIKEYNKECENYLENLKGFCQENNDEEYVGEIVNIPHADGYARYMVASMKPLELIHIPLGDAWHSEYAELLTPKKVKEKIDGERRLAEIFGHK